MEDASGTGCRATGLRNGMWAEGEVGAAFLLGCVSPYVWGEWLRAFGTAGGPYRSLGLRHSTLLPPHCSQEWELSKPGATPLHAPHLAEGSCAQLAVGQGPAWWPCPHPVPAAILLLLQSDLTSPLPAPLTLQPRLFMVSLSFSHDFQGNEAHGLWPRTGASSTGLAQHSALPLPSLLLGVRRESAYSAAQGAACYRCCCTERNKTQRANVKLWKGGYGGVVLVMAAGSSLGVGPCVELWDAVHTALWPNCEPHVNEAGAAHTPRSASIVGLPQTLCPCPRLAAVPS